MQTIELGRSGSKVTPICFGILGTALADELHSRLEELVIATKRGLRRVDGRLVRDSSRAWLRQGVEESLRARHRRR